jgi:hypothetical protein
MASPSALQLLTERMPAREAAASRDLHAWPVILDASAIIDDILYRTGPRPRSSALKAGLLVGVVRPLGKPDLVDELERNLPEVAAREGRALGVMQGMLVADYVPHLRLVDVAGITFEHGGLAKLRPCV